MGHFFLILDIILVPLFCIVARWEGASWHGVGAVAATGIGFVSTYYLSIR